MQSIARFTLLGILLASGLLLASCQVDSSSSDMEWLPLYGDGMSDTSPVIARVDEVEITQNQLDLYLDEMSPRNQFRYKGDEGRRLLLKEMVDQVLFVKGAMDNHLYRDQSVSRTLISRRRVTLEQAMRQVGLLGSAEPTTEELRVYYENHPEKFRQEGAVLARHIECLTQAEADAAYARLQLDGRENDFLNVGKDFTKNFDSAKQDYETGWFNPTGMIPFIPDSKEFIAKVYPLEIGLHPPVQVQDRWHVVEVLQRKHERPMNFNEAERTVRVAMLPSYHDAIIKDYLLQARQTYQIEMLGDYALGKGVDAKTLMARGMAVADPQNKIDLFHLVFTDYPGSDEADEALFMAAMVCLDFFQDQEVAARYLHMVVEDYPESEIFEDASFLLENIHNPKFLNPQSIEDLRK